MTAVYDNRMQDPLVLVHADTPAERIHDALEQLYTQSPQQCINAMFRLRSPNHGGQREQFHVCGRWLAVRDPALLLRNLSAVPTHGTYKDILLIGAGTPIEHDVLEFYAGVLMQDYKASKCGINGRGTITNAAKYAPMRHCVLDQQYNMVSKIVAVLRKIGTITTAAAYRKLLIKPLRAILATRTPSVYSAIRCPGIAMPTDALAPPRELVAYYLASRPYNRRVEDQWRLHVAAARPLTTPRPELAHVITHVLLFLDTAVIPNVIMTTTRYTTFNTTTSLEEKVRHMLKIYDPAGTRVQIRGRVYDLSISCMLPRSPIPHDQVKITL